MNVSSSPATLAIIGKGITEMSLGAQVVAWTNQLALVSSSPRLDVELLAGHVLQLSRAQLITRSGDDVETEMLQLLDNLVARRKAGEPIAYLTGEREFWSLPFKITPDVLIPRPETELLVELALARIAPDTDFALADIGTGSGAIALAIAHARPRAHIIATDISGQALAVARENAQRHGLTNVEFRQGVSCEPIQSDNLSLIVSNPPYVAASDPHLEQGDLRFEPKLALAAGPDGLGVLREIIACAAEVLSLSGMLMVEHGYDQGEPVQVLFARSGFREIRLHHDLAGLPRATLGIKHA